MVLELVFGATLAFVFLMLGTYAGALRALAVYFDPDEDSIFLSDDAGPPERR